MLSDIKPIFTSLSPNVEKDDILLAFKLLFMPWKWKKGASVTELENKFKEYLKVSHTFSFNSGRVSLVAILSALGIEQGDEILTQAFTCNAVVNSITNRGAKPIFVDIDSTLNIDPIDFQNRISNKTRAVIIQHTFGFPAKMDKILEIAKKNNLILIEDLAHCIGTKYQGKLCGTFGDVSFFSFGRSKVISSVFGGLAATNDKKIAERIKAFQDNLGYPSYIWVARQLLHPILVNLVLYIYGLSYNLGRVCLVILQRFCVLSKAISKKEKLGKMKPSFFKKMPNALSVLAIHQFEKIRRFNEHRRRIADLYERELKNTDFVLPFANTNNSDPLIFMRYPILVNFDTNKFLEKARKQKLFLNDGWRKSPIVPIGVNIENTGYVFGSCLRAEKTAQSIINLPCSINISIKRAEKIIKFLKVYELKN